MKTMYRLFLILFVPALYSCHANRSDGCLTPADAPLVALIDSAQSCIDGGQETAALVHLKQAEKLLNSETTPQTRFRVYQLIGWINENAGSNQLALAYFDKALVAAKACKSATKIVDALINQANVYNNAHQPDSAYRVNEQARHYLAQADAGQQSSIMKNMAYYEMLHGRLSQAEEHAYKAALLANDSSSAGNAISLLCYIYLKQGQDQRAQMVMSILPKGNATLQYNRLLVQSEYMERHNNYQAALDTYKQLKALSDSLHESGRDLEVVRIQNQMDQERLQREKMEQQLSFSIAIIALLLVIFVLTIWYFHRTQRLYADYQQRITQTRQQLWQTIGHRHADIAALKKVVDEQVMQLNQMRKQLPGKLKKEKNDDSIEHIKLGVDTLYAILQKQNISQLGRSEQKAVMAVLWNIDPILADFIDKSDTPLTPKETFFCIMERHGMTDTQKARAFCCSEQAVRSTKSRLGKKLNITALGTLSTSAEASQSTSVKH